MKLKLIKQLVAERVKAASVLLNNKCYTDSYYLSGYIVEIAIKGVIATRFKKNEIPDKKW